MKKFCSLAVVTVLLLATSAMATTITFSGLAGANQDPFASYNESGYTVTSTAGNWFEAHAFGNPVPDIFAGPIGSPSTSTVSVTGLGLFTFGSVDLASNNGDSRYLFEGWLGGLLLYSDSGSLLSNAGFATILNSFAGISIDTLFISIVPGGGTTSMNLDNIVVNGEVPEPGSLLLLGSGLLGLGGVVRRKLSL